MAGRERLGLRDELLGCPEGRLWSGTTCLWRLQSQGRVPPAELSDPTAGSEEVDFGICAWLLVFQKGPTS